MSKKVNIKSFILQILLLFFIEYILSTNIFYYLNKNCFLSGVRVKRNPSLPQTKSYDTKRVKLMTPHMPSLDKI